MTGPGYQVSPELRFFVEGRRRVLQQKWYATFWAPGVDNPQRTEVHVDLSKWEWRDVPLVLDANA